MKILHENNLQFSVEDMQNINYIWIAKWRQKIKFSSQTKSFINYLLKSHNTFGST